MFIQRNNEPGKGKWAFPGGSLKKDKSFEGAALREVKEEIGLDVEIKRLLGVYLTWEYDPNYEIHCFVAESRELEIKPSFEIMDWKWCGPEEGLNLDLTSTTRQALEDFLKIKATPLFR